MRTTGGWVARAAAAWRAGWARAAQLAALVPGNWGVHVQPHHGRIGTPLALQPGGGAVHPLQVEAAVEARLRGPHSFPLERLLHVFYVLYVHHDGEEGEEGEAGLPEACEVGAGHGALGRTSVMTRPACVGSQFALGAALDSGLLPRSCA